MVLFREPISPETFTAMNQPIMKPSLVFDVQALGLSGNPGIQSWCHTVKYIIVVSLKPTVYDYWSVFFSDLDSSDKNSLSYIISLCIDESLRMFS